MSRPSSASDRASDSALSVRSWVTEPFEVLLEGLGDGLGSGLGDTLMDVHGDALSEPARVDSLGVASFGVLGVLGVLATSGSVKLEGGFALPLKGSLRSSALPSGAAGVCGDMGGILVPSA